MLWFGHIGLTLGVARVLSRKVDARWVAVAAVLPDVIDKPLRYFIAPAFTQGNTRTVGHSLTVLVVSMVLTLLLPRPAPEDACREPVLDLREPESQSAPDLEARHRSSFAQSTIVPGMKPRQGSPLTGGP